MSLADELLKLQRLRESGRLTGEEFEFAKAKLLSAESDDGDLAVLDQREELIRDNATGRDSHPRQQVAESGYGSVIS